MFRTIITGVATLSLAASPALARQQQQQQVQQYQSQQPINVYAYTQQQQQVQQQQQQIQQQQQQQQFQNWQAQQQQYAQQNHHRLGQPGQPQRGTSVGPAPASVRTATVPVRINGRTFQVSAAARERLTVWLKDNIPAAKAGMWVAVVAAVMQLWGFVTLDGDDLSQSWDLAEAIHDVRQTDIDELVTQLSAPDIWNRAVRAQMAGMLEYEIYDAYKRNAREEMRMWQHLRDVIAHPERYQGQGIQLDQEEDEAPALRVRGPAGERLRAETAWRGLNGYDQQQLAALTNVLWHFPASRDLIASADYLARLEPAQGAIGDISKRDRMLINEALLSLPPQVLWQVRNANSTNASHPMMSRAMWSDLSAMGWRQVWRDDTIAWLTPDADDLGFIDDDPEISDLVTGAYPYYLGWGVMVPAFGPFGETYQVPGTVEVYWPVS